MIDTKDIQPTDFVSIYKDIAEVIGIEATMKLHDNFQGQQLVLPKKLYTKDFIVKSIKQKADGLGISEKSHLSVFHFADLIT